MDALHWLARRGSALPAKTTRGTLEREAAWSTSSRPGGEPDEGIWEVRGPPQHFTHSKVMAWVAFDRAVKSVEQFGPAGPGRALARDPPRRSTPRSAARASTPSCNTFTQYYGSKQLDASLLMIPLVGFLPADDPRMVGTVEAIQRELMRGRLRAALPGDRRGAVDGLPPGEGAFLPCTFWLADNLALHGRDDEARALFERLLALRNDVGLLSEEYDPHAGRLVGNFPQAFTHVALVNTARNLSAGLVSPSEHRGSSETQ